MIPQLKAKLDTLRQTFVNVDSTDAQPFDSAVSILMPVIEKLIEQRNHWPKGMYPDYEHYVERANKEILKLLEQS